MAWKNTKALTMWALRTLCIGHIHCEPDQGAEGLQLGVRSQAAFWQQFERIQEVCRRYNANVLSPKIQNKESGQVFGAARLHQGRQKVGRVLAQAHMILRYGRTTAPEDRCGPDPEPSAFWSLLSSIDLVQLRTSRFRPFEYIGKLRIAGFICIPEAMSN